MEKLFHELLKLCLNNDCNSSRFYYVDTCTSLNTTVRIFSYSSTPTFCSESALECRGIMFEIDGNKQPVRIMTRPMEKIFNYKEKPITTNLDLSEIEYVTIKADGSLISTYIDKGEVFLKSKSSLKSDQAVNAMAFLNKEDNVKLLKRVRDIAKDGFTLNFEYVSLENRIVLAYKQTSLILLNIRNNETGDYLKYDDISCDKILRPYLVEHITVRNYDNAWIDSVRSEREIEGYVVQMKNNFKFKLKTEWYLGLHHGKNSVRQSEHLFKSIISDKSDDLKSFFEVDTYDYNRILKHELIHKEYLENGLQILKLIYEEYQNETRKEFAIKTKNYLKTIKKEYFFGLAMSCYGNGFESLQLIKQLNTIFLINHKLFTMQYGR